MGLRGAKFPAGTWRCNDIDATSKVVKSRFLFDFGGFFLASYDSILAH